jgi:hypothetical protein
MQEFPQEPLHLVSKVELVSGASQDPDPEDIKPRIENRYSHSGGPEEESSSDRQYHKQCGAKKGPDYP